MFDHEFPNPPTNGTLARDVTRDEWKARRLPRWPFKPSSLRDPLDVIAERATPAGQFTIRPKKVDIDFGGIGASVNGAVWWARGKMLLRPIAEDRKQTLYQLTLPPECWPSASGETVTVAPQSFALTTHCICAARHLGDDFALGCIHCRNIVRLLVNAHFGLYWPEVERAVYHRPDRGAPATVDVGKINLASRASVLHALGEFMWLYDDIPDHFPGWNPPDVELFSTARAYATHHMSRFESDMAHPSPVFTQRVAEAAARAGQRRPCPECGGQCAPTAKYCEHCGEPL